MDTNEDMQKSSPANGASGIREAVAAARSFGGGQMESDPAGVEPFNKGESRVRRDRFTTIEGRSVALLCSDLINELESRRFDGQFPASPETQRALSEAQTALQKAADALWHVYH